MSNIPKLTVYLRWVFSSGDARIASSTLPYTAEVHGDAVRLAETERDILLCVRRRAEQDPRITITPTNFALQILDAQIKEYITVDLLADAAILNRATREAAVGCEYCRETRGSAAQCCAVRNPERPHYRCTRLPGHDGPHVACCDGSCQDATWVEGGEG